MDHDFENNNPDLPEASASGNPPANSTDAPFGTNPVTEASPVEAAGDTAPQNSFAPNTNPGGYTAPAQNGNSNAQNWNTNPQGGAYTPNPGTGNPGVYSQNSYQPRQNNPYSGQQNGYTPGAQQNAGNPYGNGYYQQPYRPQQNPYTQQSPYNNGYTQTAAHPVKKEKRGASKGFVIGMVALGMVISLLIGIGSSAAYYSYLSGKSSGSSAGGASVIVNYVPKGETPTVTDKGDAAYVASVAANSVVEVTTETVSTDSYFGQYVTQGAGSGVIISSGEGGSYIITCAHVIEGATKVTVTLKDGTQYEAALTASDSQTDIGIIKLNVSGLTAATIADFSQVAVGEGVVAIGNPLGELGGSVTSGIVSALDRDVIIDGTTYHLLQTNAEINPGNSGGGLFNMSGELIGVVNAKSSGDNVEGLGFAIPIDEAMIIATELIENGYVTGRVQLGFTLLELNSEEAVLQNWQYSKYFTGYGIYIIEAINDEFHPGDRLVAIDSITVDSIASLKGMLLEFEVGQTVTVTVARINSSNKVEMIDIDLTLTERKS